MFWAFTSIESVARGSQLPKEPASLQEKKNSKIFSRIIMPPTVRILRNDDFSFHMLWFSVDNGDFSDVFIDWSVSRKLPVKLFTQFGQWIVRHLLARFFAIINSTASIMRTDDVTTVVLNFRPLRAIQFTSHFIAFTFRGSFEDSSLQVALRCRRCDDLSNYTWGRRQLDARISCDCRVNVNNGE